LEDGVPLGTDATTLLRRWTDGDSDAMNEVVTVLYEQMHRIAAGQLRHERHLTIQPTQLVNDVYLRLIDLKRIDWQDRSHFLAMFARIARRTLVDEARKRSAGKRRGQSVTLSTQLPMPAAGMLDVLQMDEMLTRLTAIDEIASNVVELRVFSGLSLEEVAAYLEVSPSTISRKWRAAKAWLAEEFKDSSS